MVKLSASTLTEVVVAMVLLSIVATAAVLIYFNTISVLYNTTDIRLNVLVNSGMSEYIEKKSTDDWSKVNSHGDILVCTSIDSERWEDVVIVECIASDSSDSRSTSLKQAVYLVE